MRINNTEEQQRVNLLLYNYNSCLPNRCNKHFLKKSHFESNLVDFNLFYKNENIDL